MFSEVVVKKSEAFIINMSMKSHYRKREYVHDDETLRNYLKYFTKTPLKLFLPEKDPGKKIIEKFKNLSNNKKTISFSTPFNPVPLFKDEYSADKELKKVKVHFFPNKKRKSKRAIIYLHGWGRDSFRFEEQFQFRIFQNAYHADIYALELPYHHSRNPRGFSGQGFLDGDPIRTIEGFRQATIEAYYLYNILKEVYENVGIIGVSLGAHIVIMFNLVLKKPIFSLACLVGSPLRENLKNLKISPNLLQILHRKEVIKILTLLDFNKITVKYVNESAYLFGGKFDIIIAPKTVINLGKHIRSKTYILPVGHFTFPLYFPLIVKRIAYWS
ncbi:MAG: alpha/beta fold hydrolase [Candidatus Thorarchaeota archaeon]